MTAPQGPAAETEPVRRVRLVVEFGAALGMLAVVAGVWLKLDLGWALIAGGVLTLAFFLVIVDVPIRRVYTGPRDEGR